MCVGHMGMAVVQAFMRMGVAMRANRHGVVHMVVVPIGVVMRMLVGCGFMHMRMPMVFCQMQNHATQHKNAADCHPPPR